MSTKENQMTALVDRVELSAHLGLSMATLDRRVHDGTVPSIFIGRLRRFDLEAVMNALTAGQQIVEADTVCGRDG